MHILSLISIYILSFIEIPLLLLESLSRQEKQYHGHARKCCSGIRQCFVTMENSFTSVKLQASGNQNMNEACRKLNTDLDATESCTVSWTGNCHRNVNAAPLAEPFHDILENLHKVLDKHCKDLPPERTTMRKKTTTAITTTLTSTTSPFTSSSSTTISSSTTTTTKPTTMDVITTSLENETTVSVTTSDDDVLTSRTASPPTVSSSLETDTPNDPTKDPPRPSGGTSVSTTKSTPTTIVTRGSNSTSKFSSKPLVSTISTSPIQSTTVNDSDLSRTKGVVYPDSGSDSTIIIVSSVVGGILLLCVISLCLFVLYKKRQNKNSESGGSLETSGKPSLFKWLFESPRATDSVNTDTEIYAEIDEAFMEAVYRYDKEKPNALRDRISSNSQFNVCYESSFHEDAIITSRDTIASKTNSIETSIVVMEPLSPLALIRKEDDAITSFQIDQSKTQKLQDSQNIGNTALSSQKGFLTRRPGFTDIRSDSSCGDYVYIEALPNDVFEDEEIYAVPSFEESDYDTAEYGRNAQRNIPQAPAPEPNYNAFHLYTNVDHSSIHKNTPVPTVQQNVKEYRRSSSDLEIDNNLYENQDTLMEY